MTEDELRSAAKALKTAKACLGGEISAIEACWDLSGFAVHRKRFLSVDDAKLFIGIQSETDALPVGSLKDNWHPDFLPSKLNELNKYESMVSNDVRGACGRLVAALEAAGVESR